MRGKHPENVVPTLCACGEHAFAATNRGFTVMVSSGDAGFLTKKWFAFSCAFPRMTRAETVCGVTRTLALAREIMNPPVGLVVDHINCDPLDNRRANLRVCTQAENMRNRRKYRQLLPKGAHPERGRFRAYITVEGVRSNLGIFETSEQAHSAYVAAATRLHGEYARSE